jgi:cytidyltransferase-like protein
VVLANGVFDILHGGHLKYLKAASKLGWLYVSVTRDRSVNKGPRRPLLGEQDRLQIIKELRCVNGAILVDSSLEALKKIKPDIFVKGSDYLGRILQEDLDWCAENNCLIKFTGKPIDSSTKYHALLRQG